MDGYTDLMQRIEAHNQRAEEIGKVKREIIEILVNSDLTIGEIYTMISHLSLQIETLHKSQLFSDLWEKTNADKR